MQLDNVEDLYPLSPMQQGMLFHTLYDQKTGVYFQQIVYTLEGVVDAAALGRAWQQVVERHPALRCAFVWQSLDTPLQVVRQQAAMPWAEHDWRGEPPERQREQLDALLAEQRRNGFALDASPLMNATLVRTANERAWLIWNHHHIILDAWSSAIVLGEVFARYAGQPVKPAPPFRDYIAWLQQQDLAEAETYWRSLLAGFQAATPLPYDNPPGQRPIEPAAWSNQSLELSEALSAKLRALAQQQRLTLNTLVRGAWALLLSRHSGSQDVVFGSTTSGRPVDLPGVEAIVGLFINTMPVRVHANAGTELLPWLHVIQADQIRQERYAYSPLVEVQGWSAVPRGQPLFESLLVFENAPADSATQLAGSGLAISDIQYSGHTSYPLTLEVAPGPALFFNLQYDTGRFEATAVARLLGQLQTLLQAMAENPQRQLADLPWLTGAERQQLDDWNATAVDYPASPNLHSLIERRVAHQPEAPALLFGQQTLTYAELNQRANQLAHALVARGAGPDTLVGVCMERSVELVVALLACLKVGAYVPFDPAYPADRLAFMLEDAGPAVLLVHAPTRAQVPHKVALLDLDAEREALERQPEHNPGLPITPEHLAYMIYTSGSTGRPKGALNTHAGICNRLLWMQAHYQLEPGDRVLQKTPFSFDVSVWEFFWPLLSGAALVVAPPGAHQDPAHLAALIAEHQITTLHFVPSMLRMFLEQPGLERLSSLRRVICSGEALPAELQTRFFARLRAELHNLYGPTEAAVDVTAWACQPGDARRSVPIGRPIANTQIHILDRRMQLVPAGVPGNLFLGGVQLARGYHNRPDLTAERFVPNPFAERQKAGNVRPGEDPQASSLAPQASRLYNTGDLARWLPDGTIEFLGRSDFQVKLRGFRIELGEIEVVLLQHPLVAQAAVALREDVPGDQRLVAYIVPAEQPGTKNQEPGDANQEPSSEAGGRRLEAGELKTHLGERLPAYMVPAAYVWLGALPLTPSGKLDRRALPDPGAAGPVAGAGFVAPRTFVEERLAALWRDLLHVDQVGVEDSFFALGGHSLLLMQLASQIQEAFEVEVPLRMLFDQPTVAEMGRAIAERMVAQVDPAEFDELLSQVQSLSPEELQAILQADTQ